MAFSMLERPKLANTKSLKFYPEDYNQQVSFRHKNLPSNFDLGFNPKQFYRDIDKNSSIRPQISHDEKCPIYVHKMYKNTNFDGDFFKNKTKKQLIREKKSVLEKLEESYWANWKPDKNDNALNLKPTKSPEKKIKNTKSPEIHVIKGAPESKRKKNKIFTPTIEISEPEIQTQIESDRKEKKTQEIQTEIPDILQRLKAESPEESTEDIIADTKFLKLTDSLILHTKKQKEVKEHFEQPKCIRLYKKPGKLTKNYVKGGSYPLKSCLKKESNFATKGNIRLGRPGSPIIVSSNFSHNHKHKHHHKR